MSAFGPVLDALLRASLYGGLFIGAVWMVCRLFPRLPASVRCGLWWTACLKLMLDLVWIAPVPLPLLPAETSAPAVEAATLYIRNAAAPRTLVSAPSPEPSLPASPREERGVSWESALVAAWLLGLLILSLKMMAGLRRTRRVLRSAEPLREGWIRAAFLDLCARLSLRRAPELRGSGEVGTPQVTGLLRPVVLIPHSGLARLSAAEVSMTLCHELVHLRRRDLWLGWVPALAQRLFFFHPLAALAAREYAIAREAACDAEVIRVLGSAPQAYGRLLLRWGVAPRETGLAAAGASPSAQNLKRRLQMLQQTSDSRKRSAWWWLAGAALLVGLVPIQIVAQEGTPSAEEALAPVDAVDAAEPVLAEAPEAVPAEPAEPVEPAEALAPLDPLSEPLEPLEELEGMPVAIAQAPTPAPPPPGVPAPARAPRAAGRAVPAVPPAAPAPYPPAAPVARAHPAPKAHPVSAVAPMPGVPAPPPPARAPKAVPGRPALAPAPAPAPVAMAYGTPAPAPRAAGGWAVEGRTPPPAPPAPPRPPVPPKPPKEGKHSYSYSYNDNGDSWVVLKGEGNTIMNGSSRDVEKVRRLRKNGEDIFWFRRDGKAYVVRDAATLARVEQIWEPLGRLGAKQGELGAEQGKLGGKQGALGAKQGALGARQGALAAEQATRRGNEADDREIEKRQREIEEDMDQLSREMEDLGDEMEALGRQMEEMGRQMEAAGAKAEKDMQSLMAQAIRSGAAQEVR